MKQSIQELIWQESETDEMLSSLPSCKTCGTRLSGNELLKDRYNVIGNLCMSCEAECFGATLA